MKAIKIKVRVVEKNRVEQTKEELRWCWNEIRFHAIMHHCTDWYDWWEKQSKGTDLFPKGFKIDDEIKRVPLMFSSRGAWLGAACKIASGGKVWRKDESYTIPYKENGEIKYKHGAKLVDGDRPYTPNFPKPYKPPVAGIFKGVGSFNVGLMQDIREDRELEPLTIYAKYFYGVLEDFQCAWKAYLDTKQKERCMPRYKDGKKRKITSLYNNQSKDLERNFLIDGVFHIKDGSRQTIQCVPIDRTWKKRMRGMFPRSYRLVEQASGTYLCITLATEAECMIPTAKARQRKRAIQLKNEHKGLSKDDLRTIRNADSEYLAAGLQVEGLQQQAGLENAAQSKYNKPRNAEIEYKLKVFAVAETSHIKFGVNTSRIRIDEHIAQLQHRLDVMINSNDKKQGKSYRYGKRPATKNENKLRKQIKRLHERAKNSTTAYNQKMSTRFVRMAGRVKLKKYNVRSMLRSPESLLDATGTKYLPNGKTHKKAVNRMLKNASIGQLQDLIEAKAKASGKWVEPPKEEKPKAKKKPAKKKQVKVKAIAGKTKKKRQKVA